MKISQLKIKEWWNRYAIAEGLGLVGTVLFAYGTYKYTGNEILAAYMGAIGENIGYYGVIIIKEFKNESYTGNSSVRFWKKIRNLLFEFGLPELLDFLIIRPFFLFITPRLLGNYIFGIIIGKFLAEIFFYGGTIALYESRKKLFKN